MHVLAATVTACSRGPEQDGSPGGTVPACHLSDEGLVEVHRLKELQKNRAARLRHTMDAFHRWLFDTAGDQKPINPVLFLATPPTAACPHR